MSNQSKTDNASLPTSSNQLSRFLFDDLAVRGIAVQLDSVWRDIHEAYAYPEEIMRILGEAVTATTMLAGNIKFSGSLKLQIHNQTGDQPNNQPIKLLLAQCRDDLHTRGLVHWRDFATDQSHLSLADSQIALTLQHDNTGRDYQGLIDASSGSLAIGLETYYDNSEQLPTRIWLFIHADYACGIMLQRMPAKLGKHVDSNADNASTEADPAQQEALDDGWQRLQMLTDTLKAEEIATLPIQEILHRLYHEEQVELLAAREVHKHCPCINEQRIENMLKGLGQQELEETIEQEGIVRVNCEFCNTDFEYDAIDVQQLFNTSAAPGSDMPQ